MKKFLSSFLILLTLLTSFSGPVSANATFAMYFMGGQASPDVPLDGTERAVAKGGAVATNQHASGQPYTRLECRGLIIIGQGGASEIRLEDWNGWVGNGENNGPNNITVSYALEKTSGGAQTVQMYWAGGGAYKTLAPDQSAITQPVYPAAFGLANFAAGTTLRWRLDLIVPTNNRWVYSAQTMFPSGETVCYKSNAASTQLLSTGALSNPSGGVSTNEIHGPTVIVGKMLTPKPAVMIAGDSVTAGSNDTADTGSSGGGFINRGLRQATGGQLASSTFARSSEQGRYWASDSNYRQSAMKYFTHWHDHLGGADGLNGRSRTQILNDLKVIWGYFRDNGNGGLGNTYISHSSIQPATTSTSTNWTSAADQSCISPVSCPGELRDLANADVVASIGQPDGVDAVFDPNLEWEDQSNPSKWASNGTNDWATADGTHPSPLKHGAAGDDFADFVDANYHVGVSYDGQANFAGSGLMTAAATVSFNPAQLSLISWLDAGTGVTESGGGGTGVTSWDDKIGSYSATQAGSSTLRPAITTYNGIPIINFDGSNDYLDYNLPNTLFQSGNSATFFLVYRKTNLGVGNQYIFGYAEAGGAQYGGVGVGNDGTHKWSAGGYGSQITPVAGGGNNNLHIMMYRVTYGSAVNGSLDGPTVTTASGTHVTSDTTNFNFGRERKNLNQYFKGGIVGFLVFNTSLSNSDANLVGNYLETYYNPSSGDAVWSDLP